MLTWTLFTSWILVITETPTWHERDITWFVRWHILRFVDFCWPGGLQLANEQREDSYHFLVFTDLFGNRTHGVIVQYYRAYQVQTHTHSHIMMNSCGVFLNSDSCFLLALCSVCPIRKELSRMATSGIHQSPVFIHPLPCVSSPSSRTTMPWETAYHGNNSFKYTELMDNLAFVKCWTRLYICIFYSVSHLQSLSLLVQLRPARQADFEETIKEFSAKLSLVPLPPPGQLHVVRKLSAVPSFSVLVSLPICIYLCLCV